MSNTGSLKNSEFKKCPTGDDEFDKNEIQNMLGSGHWLIQTLLNDECWYRWFHDTEVPIYVHEGVCHIGWNDWRMSDFEGVHPDEQFGAYFTSDVLNLNNGKETDTCQMTRPMKEPLGIANKNDTSGITYGVSTERFLVEAEEMNKDYNSMSTLFKEFRNKGKNFENQFIETGTFVGNGVRDAWIAGFTKIRSCEKSPKWHLWSRRTMLTKLEGHMSELDMDKSSRTPEQSTRCGMLAEEIKNKYKNIGLYFGSSEETLNDMISDINEPIMFWLDAHFSGADTEKSDDGTSSPLSKELEIIATHPIKEHTIIIDDFDVWEEYYGFTMEDVKDIILKINKNYVFELSTDSGIPFDKNVLFAYIKG